MDQKITIIQDETLWKIWDFFLTNCMVFPACLAGSAELLELQLTFKSLPYKQSSLWIMWNESFWWIIVEKLIQSKSKWGHIFDKGSIFPVHLFNTFEFKSELLRTWRINFFCSLYIDSATPCEHFDVMCVSSILAQNLLFTLKVDPIFQKCSKKKLWDWIAENVMA